MNQFKWYRKLCGGIWYYNRYTPLEPVFKWERKRGRSFNGIDILPNEGVTVMKVEEYRTELTRLKKRNRLKENEK